MLVKFPLVSSVWKITFRRISLVSFERNANTVAYHEVFHPSFYSAFIRSCQFGH